jgi:hypothetical protein
MRIAYLILAHRYPEQLIRLVKRLNTPDNCFLIHLDRKADDGMEQELRSRLEPLGNVRFVARQACYWGDFSLLKATLVGLAAAFSSDLKFDWLVLLTGQDYPLRSNGEIAEFLAAHGGKQFVEAIDYRIPPDPQWPTSGSDRVDYWHVSLRRFKLVFPAPLTANTANRERIKKYALMGIFAKVWAGLMVPFRWMPFVGRRSFPKGYHPHIGSHLLAVSRDCAEYIHTFAEENPDFVHFFKYVDNPEEVFIPTIVMNSPFRDSVVNENLHFIDWQNPNPSAPRVFVAEDAERLFHSPKLFARKFDGVRDPHILNLLDQRLIH